MMRNIHIKYCNPLWIEQYIWGASEWTIHEFKVDLTIWNVNLCSMWSFGYNMKYLFSAFDDVFYCILLFDYLWIVSQYNTQYGNKGCEKYGIFYTFPVVWLQQQYSRYKTVESFIRISKRRTSWGKFGHGFTYIYIRLCICKGCLACRGEIGMESENLGHSFLCRLPYE